MAIISARCSSTTSRVKTASTAVGIDASSVTTSHHGRRDVVKTVLRPESQALGEENWRAYRLLVEGVPVEYRDASGAVRPVRARLIDFDDPANNDLLAVNQFTVQGRSERR